MHDDPLAPALGVYLRSLGNDVFEARLQEGCDVARTCHGFWPNEIEPAVAFLRHVRDGSKSILVGSPMQSGKTNIMGGIMVLCTELTRHAPERLHPRGVYICANNQIDFRSQSMSSLCHHMQVLTLRERRRWQETSDTPLIVFYDESHFGDGVRMTIMDFLSRNNVFGASRNMIFCGVSATPWSSMNQLDADIFADVAQLEANNYNSVGMMLERGRIVEADLLFVDKHGERLTGAHANNPAHICINQRSNAYRHIADIMAQPSIDGYCVIRCRKHQGKKLLRHLAEVYGQRIYGVEWNQHQREFNADFFKERRYGRLTVVVVQHKARMGNRIDTKYIHYFYEHSPTAHVDTLAQSFIGRACGFFKQDHKCIVYTHVAVAEIYDACMGRARDMQKFSELCALHRKRPGLRAELKTQPKGFAIRKVDEISFPRPNNFRRDMGSRINKLKVKHIALLRLGGRGYIRQRSKWSNPDEWRNLGKINACAKEPSSWVILVDDCDVEGTGKKRRKVLSPTITVTLWVRSDRRMAGTEPGIRPKETSLFYDLPCGSHRPDAASPLRPAHSDLDDNITHASGGGPLVDQAWMADAVLAAAGSQAP